MSFNARFTAPLALALAAGACGENPVTPAEHDEPAGLVIELDGQALVTVGQDGVPSDSITLTVGQDLAPILVVFTDEHGDKIQPEPDYHLEVETATGAEFAEFVHDSPGSFGGLIRGLADGRATMRFKFMHGAVGSGHPEDFTHDPIVVRVEPQNDGTLPI